MNQPSSLANALKLATFAHNGQTRKFNGTPYICHLLEVVATLRHVGISDDITLAAALLHDIIEDTHVDESMLSGLIDQSFTSANQMPCIYDSVVTDIVRELTDNKLLTKLERHDALLARILTMSESAINVKLADLISNMMAKPHKWDEKVTRSYYAICKEVIETMSKDSAAVNQALLALAKYAHDCQTRGSAFYTLLCDGLSVGNLYWSLTNEYFVIAFSTSEKTVNGVIIDSQLNELFQCGLLHTFRLCNSAAIDIFCAERHSESGEDFAYAVPLKVEKCLRVAL
ncbi:MAG: HD domain-containing protein [Glaciecola sp.]|jgi:hypothetical protein